MTVNLTKKLIEVTIEFNSGTIDTPVYNEKKTFSGLHIQARIEVFSGVSQSRATCRIYGMSDADMNRLTVTGAINPTNRLNRIMIAAGDKGGLMRVVYQGSIGVAFINALTQPSRCFEIQSFTALDVQLTPVKASSFKGSVAVADILQKLADEAGLKFENKGITAKPLDNAYFTGDTISKIKACAKATGIGYHINNGALVVWTHGQEPKSGVEVNSNLGNEPLLIGSPSCSGAFVTFNTQFFTGFALAEELSLKSKYNKPANGRWTPVKITHNLECLSPRGGSVWNTTVDAMRGNQPL